MQVVLHCIRQWTYLKDTLNWRCAAKTIFIGCVSLTAKYESWNALGWWTCTLEICLRPFLTWSSPFPSSHRGEGSSASSNRPIYPCPCEPRDPFFLIFSSWRCPLHLLLQYTLLRIQVYLYIIYMHALQYNTIHTCVYRLNPARLFQWFFSNSPPSVTRSVNWCYAFLGPAGLLARGKNPWII